MGSKSTSVVQTTTNNEQDTINGLASVKGDANTVNVLDADAIRSAFAFGAGVNDQAGLNLGRLLDTTNSLATLAMTNAAATTSSAIDAMQSGATNTASAINAAYTRSSNSGIDPMMAMLGLGALLLLGWAFKG